jgi:hypothetical protein
VFLRTRGGAQGISTLLAENRPNMHENLATYICL